MKKLTLLSLMAVLTLNPNSGTRKSEWVSLFDGETLNGWHQYNGDAVGPEWTVSDGVLTFRS